jgi:hypothetical protein
MGIIRAASTFQAMGRSVRPRAVFNGSVVAVDLWNYLFVMTSQRQMLNLSLEQQCRELVDQVKEIQAFICENGGSPIFVTDGFFKPLKENVLLHRREMFEANQVKVDEMMKELESAEDEAIRLIEQTIFEDAVVDFEEDDSGDIDLGGDEKEMEKLMADLEQIQSSALGVHSHEVARSVMNRLRQRKGKKRKINADLKEASRKIVEAVAEKTGNVEAIEQLSVSKQKAKELKLAKAKTFKLLTPHYEAVLYELRKGDPKEFGFIQAVGDAEAQCAYLCRSEVGIANLTASEDFDTLAFGAPFLVRGMIDGLTGKDLKLFNLKEVCLELRLNYEQFVEFCVLCGCDYVHGVELFNKLNINPNEVPFIAQMIRAHKKNPSLLESHRWLDPDLSKRVKDALESDLFQVAKNYFLNPDVHKVRFGANNSIASSELKESDN